MRDRRLVVTERVTIFAGRIAARADCGMGDAQIGHVYKICWEDGQRAWELIGRVPDVSDGGISSVEALCIPPKSFDYLSDGGDG